MVGESSDPDSKTCVNIENDMFPVKEFFLEDALEWTSSELANAGNAQRASIQRVSQRLKEARGKSYSDKTARSLVVAGERDVHLDLMKSLVRVKW